MGTIISSYPTGVATIKQHGVCKAFSTVMAYRQYQ